MQFADLMQLFREGQNEGRKRGYVSQGACDAEGIAAVIRALRDEFTKLGTLEFQDGWAVLKKFNEILGDAGDKVAGGPRPEAMGGTPPATDPAPAVCDIKELVKRLRDPYRVGKGNFDVMVSEAADALEAMAGDLSVMRLKLEAKLSTEQSEEIARLKAALEFIARGTTGSPDAIIARKALGGDAS